MQFLTSVPGCQRQVDAGRFGADKVFPIEAAGGTERDRASVAGSPFRRICSLVFIPTAVATLQVGVWMALRAGSSKEMVGPKAGKEFSDGILPWMI